MSSLNFLFINAHSWNICFMEMNETIWIRIWVGIRNNIKKLIILIIIIKNKMPKVGGRRVINLIYILEKNQNPQRIHRRGFREDG